MAAKLTPKGMRDIDAEQMLNRTLNYAEQGEKGRRIYVFHGKVLGKLEDVLKILVNAGKYFGIIG